MTRINLVFAVIVILTVFMCLEGVSASSGWIIYHESAFKGKVINAETKEPIEGAVVVAIYRIREYSFVQSDAAVADVKEVLTGKNGEFYIPPHTFVSFYPVAKGEITTFIVFKPGYASVSESNLGEILSKDTGKEVESPWLYNKDLKFIFAPGLIGLPKVKTREERLKATPGHITEARRKTPILNRLIEEDDKALGLK